MLDINDIQIGRVIKPQKGHHCIIVEAHYPEVWDKYDDCGICPMRVVWSIEENNLVPFKTLTIQPLSIPKITLQESWKICYEYGIMDLALLIDL